MRRALPLACTLLLLAGCGQKGALYLPDKNATVVTSVPATGAPPPPPPATPPAKKTGDQDGDAPPPK
jgi:predicted small lipoprotein YifL